jgi:hypothetical protein
LQQSRRFRVVKWGDRGRSSGGVGCCCLCRGEDGELKWQGSLAPSQNKPRTPGDDDFFCWLVEGSLVRRAASLLEKYGFRVRFLFLLPPQCAKLPPLFVLWRPVFIGKNIARFPTWSLNSFFCCRFDFSYFLDFSYQHRLEWGKSVILKITRYKSNAFPRSLKILILLRWCWKC